MFIYMFTSCNLARDGQYIYKILLGSPDMQGKRKYMILGIYICIYMT